MPHSHPNVAFLVGRLVINKSQLFMHRMLHIFDEEGQARDCSLILPGILYNSVVVPVLAGGCGVGRLSSLFLLLLMTFPSRAVQA